MATTTKVQVRPSQQSLGESLQSKFAVITFPLAIIAAFVIYYVILGNPANFAGNDPKNHPLEGNYLGVVYKGGIIVPMLISLLIIVLAVIIERLLTIGKANGKGNVNNFVRKITQLLHSNDIRKATEECDKQKGSVANVVRAGLHKYTEMEHNPALDQEKKIIAIRQDIEESTQLEMPMLEKNLVIISTIASIATLVGLLGTVMGMIKAFSALATAGAPDAVALANGISEALINTALGIGTSAIAIIFYNYFTSRIDSLTHGIDEAGFSIVGTFAAQNPEKVKI